tara:strand:- start:875 stop:1975 length:1101 start_codon:yes stop_codon:yes gene_type:complete
MNRREFLTSGIAVGVAGFVPGAFGAGDARIWYGARLDADGRAHASGFDADGRLRFDVVLPARAHGAGYSAARGELVVASRRPGDFLWVVDALTGRVRHRIAAASGRFFNGHAVYARGLLYATESVVTDAPLPGGNGVIGVYDAATGFARVAEFASGGHDPHQLLALGDELVVANGGLLTHPDAPGVKLNIDTMDSSVVRIDARDGRINAQHRLGAALHRVGLRHLAAAPDGTVAVVAQYEGPVGDDVPLVALLRPGRALAPLELPQQERLKNYVGSVAFDAGGRMLGLASPRGGVALFHDVDADTTRGLIEVPDGCGIAATRKPGEFVVSSGLGGVRRWLAGEGSRLTGAAELDHSRWDNHLLELA